MTTPLHIELSELAVQQIREAESWWRTNRPKAPNAIREEIERGTALIALQPHVGTRARNTTLAGVRRLHLARIHYYIYYRIAKAREQIEIISFWHASRGSEPFI